MGKEGKTKREYNGDSDLFKVLYAQVMEFQ
jgi:hypothetical protein